MITTQQSNNQPTSGIALSGTNTEGTTVNARLHGYLQFGEGRRKSSVSKRYLTAQRGFTTAAVLGLDHCDASNRYFISRYNFGQTPDFPGAKMPFGSSASLIVSFNLMVEFPFQLYVSAICVSVLSIHPSPHPLREQT